jgi:prepilin-type N-terminal cleavage/methylation domain-containing protein
MMSLSKTCKRNNSGLTFVEMIVVVLIMAIMATVTLLSANTIQRRNVDKCANKLSKMLDTARVKTMSKSDNGYNVGLVIYYYDRTYYAQIVYLNTGTGNIDEYGSKEDIGGGALDIEMKKLDYDNLSAPATDIVNIRNVCAGAADENAAFTAAKAYMVKFRKSNGQFLQTQNTITVTGSKTVNVVLVSETGRNYLD